VDCQVKAAAQAAEDMPVGTTEEQQTHLWMTRYKASLAVERRLGEWWWESLVDAQMNLQSFDRDPQGWAFDNGIDPGFHIDAHRERQENEVSWAIDNCFDNSGA
jgi:hypothetical protein